MLTRLAPVWCKRWCKLSRGRFADMSQRFNGFGIVEQPGVGVCIRRQRNIAVTHCSLGYARGNPGFGQVSPEAMPQGVNMHDAAIGIDFRDTGGSQIAVHYPQDARWYVKDDFAFAVKKRGHSALRGELGRLEFGDAAHIKSITRWVCLPCPEPG